MIFGNLEYGLATVGKTLDKLTVIGNYDFGKLYKAYDINMSDFKAFSATEISSLQEYVNALNRGSVSTKEFNEIFKGMREEVVLAADGFTKLKLATDTGAVSEGEYAVATQNLALTQKTATATSKALATALNLITNIAMTVAISLAIKGLSALVNKLIVTREELEEIRNEAVESSERLRKSAETFIEEAQSIDELLQKYQQIHASVSDTSQAKNELLQVQKDLIDKFGKEAEGLDLINGKYDENIAKVKEYTREKYNEWKTENAAEIRRAEKVAGYNFDITRDDSSNVYRRDTKIGRNRIKEIYGNDELAQSLFVIKDVSADIRQIYEDIEGLDMSYGDLLLGGDINAAIDSLSELINYYKDLGNADEEVLQQLTDHLKSLKTESDNIDYYLNNVSSVGSVFESVKNTAFNAFNDIATIGRVSGDEMRAKWLENLDEMQKGSLKNISTMVSALQDLSEGKGIAANTFWQLIEFDEQGLLNGARLVGDKFIVSEENMIKLKDQYIQKQIESIELLQKENEEKYSSALIDVQTYERKLAELSLNDKLYKTDAYQKINQQLETAKANAKAYGDEWQRNNWLIEYLNQTLGNTVDLQKQLEAQQKQLNKELTALNKELDNYQKAYEAKIDSIIKSLEAEEDELEKQLDTLEDELDVLEKQQDAIEETLDNYEKVNSYVQKIIDKEIESLEEQRDAIKDTYNERINALKAENEEREDALDYAQKLANLENARNNKRRVYDEARGWRYESVKEDVVKAESDLKTFETNQEVKKLEKERDAEIEAWDALIKKKEDYKKQWAAWLEEIQDEEAEALLVQELGADARERIANNDITLIETFSTQYRKHNSDLRILTDTEIKLKKAEIDAKNEDIKASKERIQAWKDYKTEFGKAVTEIKQSNEDYMKDIGKIELDEKSSLERRGEEFSKFKDKVSGLVDQIGQKQSAIDNITASLDALQSKDIRVGLEVDGMDEIREAERIIKEMMLESAIIKTLNGNGTASDIFTIMHNSGIDNLEYGEQTAAVIRLLKGHMANGGVADSTGIYMLHGRKNAPETIFNANDSAKLYEMVHNTPNLMADMLNQATKLSGFKLASNEVSNNNSNVSFYIDKIVTDNPVDFERQLDRYYRTKLTQSYTNKQ